MEYKKIFKVQGKHGVHTGPAEEITRKVWEYEGKVEDMGRKLKVDIIKKSCPQKINVGDEGDASQVLNITALYLTNGSELEVTATIDSENSDGEDLLKKVVGEIGEIITDVDRYTYRPHLS